MSASFFLRLKKLYQTVQRRTGFELLASEYYNFVMILTFLGLVAACCTTGSFLPQVVKAWKTKETKDLSLWMYCVLALGTFLWTIYGVLISDIAVFLANGLTFIFVLVILYLKIRHG